mgnify:FL=1
MWVQFALNGYFSLFKKLGDCGKEIAIFHFITAIFLLICLVTAPTHGVAATKNDAEIQALGKEVITRNARDWLLPPVLEEKDLRLYGQIFKLQEKGDWTAAKHLIDKLTNPLLMGHVNAQKYLHPTKYRSKYIELLQWMRKYADHPQAKRIYSLALRRRPPNWKSPPKPSGQRLWGSGTVSEVAVEPWTARINKRSISKRKKAKAYKRNIRSLIRKGWPTGAYRKLSSASFQKTLDPVEIAVARAEIAHGYFIFGKDKLALRLSKKTFEEFGHFIPLATWVGGLSAWRLGQITDAAFFFQRLGENMKASPDLRAAGAFWASRAHMIMQQPKNANEYLRLAAKTPDSFYGMLARKALGMSNGLDMTIDFKNTDFASNILSYSKGKRAVALIQLSKYKSAEEELRRLYHDIPVHEHLSLMVFAEKTGSPGLAMRIAGLLKERGLPSYYTSLYPLPAWKIPSDVVFDAALIYAIVRQESQFKLRAKSGRGARGLMQLMPRTAAEMGRDRRLRRGKGRDALFNPKINIELGSKYLSHLMYDGNKVRNLFKTLAAYNAGPGKLGRWELKINYQNDPLMFMESIPSPETRNFIEQVFVGLWIYRFRLDQPAPSLTQLAEGNWPHYKSVSNKKTEGFSNARN